MSKSSYLSMDKAAFKSLNFLSGYSDGNAGLTQDLKQFRMRGASFRMHSMDTTDRKWIYTHSDAGRK